MLVAEVLRESAFLLGLTDTVVLRELFAVPARLPVDLFKGRFACEPLKVHKRRPLTPVTGNLGARTTSDLNACIGGLFFGLTLAECTLEDFSL